MAKRPQLMLVGGPEGGRRFEVVSGGIRLGRSSSNDIHVSDEELSRNHCFFEPVGETGVRLTDLASANGTFVNGRQLASDPVMLKEGDVVEAGTTVLRVVGETRPEVPTSVDLGFDATTGDDSSSQSEGSASKPKSSAANPAAKRIRLVIVALAAVAVAAVAGLLLAPSEPAEPAVTSVDAIREDVAAIEGLYYEKVAADLKGVFRYELTLSRDGVFRVTVDDVPAENRHLVKSQTLDEAARKELGDILKAENFRGLDPEYVGETPDPPALSSWTIRVVYSSQVRCVKVVNAKEPDAFREIREKLETFSKNQLGVWALQYSRDDLIKLARNAIELGTSKWSDRDVRYGNIFEAVAAYKEAIFYLETVNPKPDCIADARKGLEESIGELDKRFKDQRFVADRAINLAQWDVAQKELRVLIDMIPDRADPRNREASAKLLDVEKRLKEHK